MGPLDKLEQWLRDKFGAIGATTFAGGEKEIPEIRREILAEIGGRIRAAGRGSYAFPYSSVEIVMYAADADKRDEIEGTLTEAALTRDVADVLAECGVKHARVDVRAETVVDEAAVASGKSFHIRYARAGSPARSELERPPARLVVIRGTADTDELAIDRDVVHLGRLKEVMDRSGGLSRRNDISFADTETTVSRKHASVRYDRASGKFRAYNDPESQSGTKVFRNGQPLACDSTRGVQLHSGDEIILGDARVRFELQ